MPIFHEQRCSESSRSCFVIKIKRRTKVDGVVGKQRFLLRREQQVQENNIGLFLGHKTELFLGLFKAVDTSLDGYKGRTRYSNE